MTEKAAFRRVDLKRRKLREILERSGLPILWNELGSLRSGWLGELKAIDASVLVVNDRPLLIIMQDGAAIPYIDSAGFFNCPTVFVDRGAIPHLLNGADVMVPGITSSDQFRKGDIVFVRGEGTARVIVVGRALMDWEEVKSRGRGKAIKNVHRVGDRLWKIVREKMLGESA